MGNGNLLTTREAAKYLGLSAATLRLRRSKSQPPVYFKIGGSIRYKTEELDKYIEDCRQPLKEVEGIDL